MRLHILPLLTLSFLMPVMAHTEEQTVLTKGSYSPQAHSAPSLTDLLTVEQSASIFYSYARELELSKLFSDNSAKITIFAPTNKAVMALARKPHQDPVMADDGISISEEEYERMSKRNVERWVSAHIVPESPIDLDSTSPYQTLLERKEISFKPVSKSNGQGPVWSRVTLENGIKILRMKEASNGVIYVIDGAIAPP
ncbi:hypothetical protein AMATHDRAFT_77840 [Amanita thiersii Skay4041]|uniref:FAS1 domain-containing protein n=1 Tax=Amanita thiersii Skay4041 TaxID=703135 RepID=A0A2A9N7I1_9AGAR|nr:hypothetical protein AMATHDRAFT_77840 [Amanita thiersii Skay4041]